MSTVLLDTAHEPLLDSSGNLVVSGDAPIAPLQPAHGVTQASQYLIELFDRAGNRVADLSPYLTKRHFVVRRNRAETVDLTFDQGAVETLCSALGTTVLGLFAPGSNDVKITRGNRALILARINYLATTVDERQRIIELRATGYFDLLHDRQLTPDLHLDYTVTPADLGQVCANWITGTQAKPNGDYGLTIGTIQPSRNTNTNDAWQPFAYSIRDAIQKITERLGSIDIEFTPDKVFKVYYPGIGVTHTDIAFTYPGNIKSLKLPIDATMLNNESYARGSGNGDQQLVGTAGDTTAQASFGLREQVKDYPACNVPQTLVDYAGEELRKYAGPTHIPDLILDGTKEPFLGSYWIGDWVPLRIDAGSAFASLNGQILRINELDVTINENDAEDVRLKVGYA
jgi:hypothetical protein